MLKDYEIALKNKKKNIKSIAKKLGLSSKEIILYGNDKAKIDIDKEPNPNSKLVLVTSINPTPYGEGKTTVAIGLHDALNQIGVPSLLTLREPSLGPVFGIKGGATGGGYAQVVPMDQINLHFTGDFHAITTANNLVSAMIDNSIYHGNPLQLDSNQIYFSRCLDLNDRELRNVTLDNGRQDKFTITAASEMMGTFVMSENMEDLRQRLDKIIIGKNIHNEYVYLKELHITGSLLALLKDAMKPNLVQTLEHNPVLIHLGPFANLAPGCNSIITLKNALALSPMVITEAGFGFDCGGFKFLDIVAREHHLCVSGIVLVVTVKALEYQADGSLEKGICNLQVHMDNLNKINITYVVILNQYDTDTKEEIEY